MVLSMDDPIEHALRRQAAEQERRRDYDRQARWGRCQARETVLRAIDVFLPRMNAAGNKFTEPYRRRFLGWERAWRVYETYQDSREGFWLSPDGRIPSGKGWVPYRSAVLFGVGPNDVEELKDMQSPPAARSDFHDQMARLLVDELARLVASAERSQRPSRRAGR
jgi:hypothetical protein